MNMKKFMAILLTLSLMLGLSVNAVAATDTGTANGSTEQPVNITITPNAAAVYSVKVTWDAFNFTYTTGKWNEETQKYNDDGTWSNPSTIEVTNNSNYSIWYSASYTPILTGDAAKGIAFKFDGTKESIGATELQSAVIAGAKTGTFTFGPTNRPSVDQMDNTQFGTISITISNTNS